MVGKKAGCDQRVRKGLLNAAAAADDDDRIV